MQRTVDEIYSECDYITIHVPALDTTKGMIDADAIGLMKDGVVVLNFARDVLVNSEAVVDGLVSGKIKHYVTDFPTPEIAGVKGAIVLLASGSFYSRGRTGRIVRRWQSKRCVIIWNMVILKTLSIIQTAIWDTREITRELHFFTTIFRI